VELRAGNWPDKKDKATANGDATICEFRDLFSFPEAMMSNFVALIVEDDPFPRESLADLLKSEGLEVVECANAGVAELVLASTGPDLRALVTDVELGGEMSGVELAQYAKRKFPDLKVVMVSGHGPPYVPQDTYFLMKPYEPQQLLDAVLG
jgi:DNA-binding NtrC family response regulator